MFGKQLANPAYPKMDTGVNPISLIKVGLIDPKDGIVAPNEPQLVIEKSAKLTLSEKICYSLVVILVVGGLVGIITYRILQESASMNSGMGPGRARSMTLQGGPSSESESENSDPMEHPSQRYFMDERMSFRRRMMMERGEFGDGFGEDIEMFDWMRERREEREREHESKEKENEHPDNFFPSFALIRILGHTTATAGDHEVAKICAGVIMNPSSVLTSPSCFKLNNAGFLLNNTRAWVVTGIDRDTIGLAVNGNLSKSMNVSDVRLVTNHERDSGMFMVLHLRQDLVIDKRTRPVQINTEEVGFHSTATTAILKKIMDVQSKTEVLNKPVTELIDDVKRAAGTDDKLLDGLSILLNEHNGQVKLYGVWSRGDFVQYK